MLTPDGPCPRKQGAPGKARRHPTNPRPPGEHTRVGVSWPPEGPKKPKRQRNEENNYLNRTPWALRGPTQKKKQRIRGLTLSQNGHRAGPLGDDEGGPKRWRRERENEGGARPVRMGPGPRAPRLLSDIFRSARLRLASQKMISVPAGLASPRPALLSVAAVHHTCPTNDELFF